MEKEINKKKIKKKKEIKKDSNSPQVVNTLATPGSNQFMFRLVCPHHSGSTDAQKFHVKVE